jgi:hypothetical protein
MAGGSIIPPQSIEVFKGRDAAAVYLGPVICMFFGYCDLRAVLQIRECSNVVTVSEYSVTVWLCTGCTKSTYINRCVPCVHTVCYMCSPPPLTLW